MVFSSGIFLIYFLPILLSGYFLIPSQFKNAYLLLFSLFFYWWGAPVFVCIVLLSSTVNFYIAQKMQSSVHAKMLLWLYVAVNLGILSYFKYANFFIENTNELLQTLGFTSIQWTAIGLPIGISFFTFQSITYGVDVYRKEALPQKKIMNYWLYILFFPQLIAGPIITYKSINKQIEQRQRSWTDVINGFYRFTLGLAKKVLIANVLASFGQVLHETNVLWEPSSTLISWHIAIAYTFEIYFDFSGYADMAIGLGKMFGFHFPENFDRPYLSKSITDFWKKWHITLGNFMKNYLYIPLGGNRKSINRTFVNLLTVFFLSGLWHGAAWNFVFWGLFHGFWLIIERLNPIKLSPKWNGLKMLWTFILVVHGWVLFNAHSLSEAFAQLKMMYSFEDLRYIEDKDALYYEIHLVIAAFICLLGAVPKLNRFYFLQISELNLEWKKVALFSFTLVVFVLCLAHIVTGSFNPFIYFQF